MYDMSSTMVTTTKGEHNGTHDTHEGLHLHRERPTRDTRKLLRGQVAEGRPLTLVEAGRGVVQQGLPRRVEAPRRDSGTRPR